MAYKLTHEQQTIILMKQMIIISYVQVFIKINFKLKVQVLTTDDIESAMCNIRKYIKAVIIDFLF